MLTDFKEQLNKNGEVYLRVKARPGAVKTVIKEIMSDDTIKIDLAAAPEKGRANKELIKILSRVFTIGKNNIKIISGAKEKLKLIKIKK